MVTAKNFKVLGLILAILFLSRSVFAEKDELKVIDTLPPDQIMVEQEIGAKVKKLSFAGTEPVSRFADPVKYTLGPNDVVEITVLRHPEFSGVYPINQEGKVQYKFVGDIEVTGLTKKELEKKISGIISN